MINNLQRYAKDHPRFVDLMVIVQVLLIAVLGSATSLREPSGVEVPWWPGALLGVIGSGALWWRRSHPAPSWR